ncbi:hypothetical protein KFE25_010886 [Diacronema lutheri]|uniref:Uncharacterized protein n=1 Tax=Diacronema lutheri TaxID=2081491 RepID=A0A8J5X8N6_DIALT|nr:hypothetical protein KFE25_010886 [Diacronema lutheri]
MAAARAKDVRTRSGAHGRAGPVVVWLWSCACRVGDGARAGDEPIVSARSRLHAAQGIPVVHTPIRLSAVGSSEIVRLMHKHNISEHVLPPPQSVLVSRRAGHVRTIVFEWPDPGPPVIPSLPISIGPDKPTEADLLNVLQALLHRYALTVHLADSDELVNTQVVGLSFARATLRLRMRDDDDDGAQADAPADADGRGVGTQLDDARGGGTAGGTSSMGRSWADLAASRAASSPRAGRSAKGAAMTGADRAPDLSAAAQLGDADSEGGAAPVGGGRPASRLSARRGVARNGQRLVVEGLTCTIGTDVHSAPNGVSARIRLTLTNLTVAFDLMSTQLLSAQPEPLGAAATPPALAAQQQPPQRPHAHEAVGPGAPAHAESRVAGLRVQCVWLGGCALRPPRAAPPAAAAAAARHAAAVAAAAAGFAPPRERVELVEAPDVEGPLRYLRRHARVHVRALDVPLSAAHLTRAPARARARRAAVAAGGEAVGDEAAGARARPPAAVQHVRQRGAAKLVTLCRSHVAASRMLRGMVTDITLLAILNQLFPQSEAAVAAICAQELVVAEAAAADAAGEARSSLARPRRPPAPQPTLPTLLARTMEDALSPAAARASTHARILRELVVERRAFALPLEADARDELARQHGLYNPALSIARWGGVDVSLASPSHALVLSDLIVRFDCELRRSVVGELTFDGAIHLVLRIAELPVHFEPRNGTILDWRPVDCTIVHSEVTADPPGASRAMLSASRVLFNPEAEVAAHVDRFIQEELHKVFQNLARDLWAMKPPRDAAASDGGALVLAAPDLIADERERAPDDAGEADAAEFAGATGEQASEWRRWAEERTGAAPRGVH